MKQKREKYVAHVTKMLTLLGEPADKAAEDAKKILALETKLAEASRTRVQLRDPIKNYNKMDVRQLQDVTPDWNWSDYFKPIDLVESGDVNVEQTEFFKAANDLFRSTSLDDWKAYLRWHLINAAAPALSKDFVDEDFNFRERSLRGTQQIKPRWKRVILSEDNDIGEALGKLYVGFYFPPEAKARALELVNNLKEALADRIKTLEWMDEPTKQEALKKLAALQKALDKHPEERAKKIDGFTPEQRVFLSFAAIWRQKIRDEDKKMSLTTDPHSPAQFRVNGPLSDLPEFQKAFGIPDGSPMVRSADKRVNIW